MIIDSKELKRRYLQRIAGARDKKVYIGPQVVSLDITSACNLSCRYCLASHAPGNPGHLQKAVFFPWKKFVDIIRDCVDLKVDEIYSTGPGEPTMHPLFREMMRHLEHQPLKVKLFTNATFPSELCLDVIRSDHVIINLGAVERLAYHHLQGRDLFDRVVNNIKRLVALRDAGKPGFLIEISYVMNAVNIRQKQRMRDWALRLGVEEVGFIEMHEDAYNSKIALLEASREREKKRSPPACLNGWFFMAVKLNGSASICCRILRMPYGDLAKNSFKKFWLSRQMMNMRLLGKYGYMPERYATCRVCPYYEINVQRAKGLLKIKKQGDQDRMIGRTLR